MTEQQRKSAREAIRRNNWPPLTVLNVTTVDNEPIPSSV